MTEQDFESMIARLERYSTERPRGYQARVAVLAALGLLILVGIIGFAGLLLVGLVAGSIMAIVTGGGLLILILKLGFKLLPVILVPLWILVRSSFHAMFSRFPEPDGFELVPAAAPALFQRLGWMRKRMKGPRFHHVLLTGDMNAAVVQRPLFGLFGFPRNYLLLGLPLLEATTESEALAVVAHEYGHLAGAHSRFGAFIYRLRRTWGTIDAIAQQWEGIGGRLLGRVVRWYAPYFNAYTFVLARSHEYLADAAAADLVGPQHASNALQRVSVAAREFDDYVGATFDRVRVEPEPPRAFAHRWASRLAEGAPLDRLRRHLDESLSRKTDHLDTHPALADRLGALGAGGDDAALTLASGNSVANVWFGDQLDALREQVGSTWATNIRNAWHQRFEETSQARARLAELAAQPVLTRDEQYEQFALGRRVDPETHGLPAIAAYRAAWPDDPRGHYALGLLRLEALEDTGLDDLETAMRLDPESTIAACRSAAAYLRERDRERSLTYAERARQREAFEQRRLAELRTPDSKQVLWPHGFPRDTIGAIESAIHHARVRHLRRAYLVRRELPIDPKVETYLLAVSLTWWGRRRGARDRVVDKLARLSLPVPNLFVCALEGKLAKLRRSVRRIEDSELNVA